MIRNIHNYIIFSLLVITICISGWSILKMIDLSITIDHQSQEMALVKEKCEVLSTLANLAKDEITKPKIEKYLEGSSNKHLYFKKETNQLVIDGVSLYFSGDSLVKIEVGLE